MLLAIIPLLAWGIGAGVVAVGGAIAAWWCSGDSSSQDSTTASQGGAASSEKKLRCLLAGYKDAGKSEFVCCLMDYLQSHECRTHANMTITTNPIRFRGGGWIVECVDGPGNIESDQPVRYANFLQDANKLGETMLHVVVFVVDLTTITDLSKKRKIKSEMEILNRCAVDARAANCLRKIHMVVIGSHMVQSEQGNLDLQRSFTGWMNEIISSDNFDVWYVCGDLYKNCSVASQFCEHLRRMT